MVDILPSDTLTLTWRPRSGRDGSPLGDPWSTNFERGVCFLDTSHASPTDGLFRLYLWTSDLLRTLRVPREIVPAMSADEIRKDRDWRTELPPADVSEYENRAYEDHVTMADECESAISDLLPAGWQMTNHDGAYFFEWSDDRVGFRFERADDVAVLYLNVAEEGAEVSADHFAHVWTIEVFNFDDDGDESDTLGTFVATFKGGNAPYINLWSAGGSDASDILSDHIGPWVSDEVEVIGLGDDRSLSALEASLSGWLNSYAQCEDGSSWSHDASHYGFPY